MSTANMGSQRIGWKFSTPLQADYLNTFISGFSSEGLITRPDISANQSGQGASLVIRPFSLLICPSDTKSQTVTDENHDRLAQKMVKVTTTNDIQLSITTETVALGFSYTFKDPTSGSTQSQWYGEVRALSPNDFGGESGFDGIIIATCQWWENPADNKKHYSVRTSGADISDFLLIREGWNPNKWLSVISPRRAVQQGGPYYDKLEVRCHNELYGNASSNGYPKGYINGNSGLQRITNVTYDIGNIRGLMPKNYNAFKLQSAGFSIAECSNTLPIEKTSGGIFAMVDASAVNQANPGTSFTNRLIINPVEQEDVNIYYDDNTLFIR